MIVLGPVAVGNLPAILKVLQGRNAPAGDLGAHVAVRIAALAVADEGTSKRMLMA